ncbi:MAG: N-acetylglutaminylglutamine synthetase [Opitutales bacterium]
MTESKTEQGICLQCGWGRLIFAHTYPSPEAVAEAVLKEAEGQRDIAFYLNDPHLVLNQAPQKLFLDPSNTYRIQLDGYLESNRAPCGFVIEPLKHKEQLDEINRIYDAHKMVPVDVDYVWQHRNDGTFSYLIARREDSEELLGVAMGVDHKVCFDDIMNGSSLWALAVDPQAELPGIGECLVRALIEQYRDNGRSYLDLSVLHDNASAIRLYDKLGFEKVSVFAVKCRNPINEQLFLGDAVDSGYNPYAAIIIKEALRRGIAVDPLDPPRGFFNLRLGGRSVTCRESLTELTTAIALQRCDDKELTRKILEKAGLKTPAQMVVGDAEAYLSFLERHRSVVVKPARGEQGQGVFVDLRTPEQVSEAVDLLRESDETILIEQFVGGQDLRIIVINKEVVAAAVRKPAEVVGTGQHTVRDLIESLSRRRSSATRGESSIPMDTETERCIRASGADFETVLPEGKRLAVRKTANLHTGGTIHDVTAKLHPALAKAAVEAAEALAIPVAGLDFIVPSVKEPEYVIIEINERPGLANHEPQPTAQKLIDFLFPQTIEAASVSPRGDKPHD